MKRRLKMAATNSFELDAIFARRKRFSEPIFLDSTPYQPYKWSVFSFYLIAFLLSISYFLKFFLVSSTPSSRPFVGWFGCALAGVLVAFPLGIFYLLNLLFKPKLLIDGTGLTFWTSGRKKSLAWRDISSITVSDLSNRNFKNPIYWTIVRGKGNTLRLPPYLGVDTRKLAQFLEDQKNTMIGR